MSDPGLDNESQSLLDRRQRWVAYIVGSLLGLALALALLALLVVTFA